MSSERFKTAVYAVIFLAGISFAGFYGCDKTDGLRAERSEPELLAEGEVDGERWAVLRFEGTWDNCLELRHRGAVVERVCDGVSIIGQWQISTQVLPGATTPLIFGVLPENAVRAEVALDGESTLRRDPERAMAPVEVREFGESGRFVAEPAPADRTGPDSAWSNGEVNVEVYDVRDTRIAPEQ